MKDLVLDLLDGAPDGTITGDVAYDGPLLTIQRLAAAADCSDSAARRAVHELRRQGLVRVFDAIDPAIGHRRLFVTGAAQ